MVHMRIRPRKLLERPQAWLVGESPDQVGGARTLRLRVDGMVCDI